MKFIIAAFLALSFTLCKAQTGTVKGIVTDSLTLESVAFANVIIEDKGVQIKGTITDFNGKFSFSGINPGVCLIKALYVGYEPYSKHITIKGNDTVAMNLRLVPSTATLEEVVVDSYRAPLISKDMTVSGSAVTKSASSYKTGYVNGKNTKSDLQNLKPGQLTASELNDFSKWELWKDIGKNELESYHEKWGICPEQRYTVQVKGKDGFPVADVVAELRDKDDDVIWSARTDNTGKAELWNYALSDKGAKRLKIVITYDQQEFVIDNPELFNEGINVVIIPADCRKPVEADIVFMVDATGSMGDEMDYLKAELGDIIDHVKKSHTDLSVRMGSVFYRDNADEYLTRQKGITEDITSVMGFVKDQEAKGGGDYEEAVDKGLEQAVMNMPWSKTARARLLFILLDAPPHLEASMKISELTVEAAKKGIRIIPVIASGETGPGGRNLEYIMRCMALATNGTYVFLTDHSHIGNEHAVPVTDQYDVELLNELIKRVINQYTWMPQCGRQQDSIKSDTTFLSNIIAHEVVDSSRIRQYIKPGDVIHDYTENDSIKTDSVLITENDSIKTDSVLITENPVITDSIPAREKKEIKFYPNPTRGIITVEITGNINELFLTDFSGKLLQKIDVRGKNKLKISLVNYSNGMYFLRFIDNFRPVTARVILTSE